MTACALAFFLSLAQFAQTGTGELHLIVTDPAGAPLEGTVELVSEANQFRASSQTDRRGHWVVKRLPFGTYHLVVGRDGFAPSAELVEIRSALPVEHRVTLTIAPLQTQITVTAGDTLIDARQTATARRIGTGTLQQRPSALPGRSLLDAVNTQPGWLLEANGILHPRGSEYQTQFVIDGLPLTDNRSPAFAPEIGAGGVQAMNVLTGGYPAEYGRKLGGVIEVVTVGPARRGFHGSAAASLGSFGTRTGDLVAEYGSEKTTIGLSAGRAETDRYLDPPTEENFTNDGRTASAALHVQRDLTDDDRFGTIVRYGGTRFLVPNERVQQDAGQRQDRDSRETAAQFSYQRIFSSRLLGDVRGMARTLSAGFESNPASTPVVADQDRGFREGYVKATLSAQFGRHEWKLGADAIAGKVRERFGYRLTDPDQFDDDTAPSFGFAATRHNREQAVFVQDQIRLGQWTINAGLRWDHYRLVVDEHAFSPRLSAAWSLPGRDLVLRASYDRAFQTPALENLLLASSDAVEILNDEIVRLPVPPSRGNFYDVGLSKGLFDKVRVDANYFVRLTRDFADDEVLLNTGVGFPIAFRHADIRGAEIKLEVPQWGPLSGFLSYGYLRGVGELPMTGGLFLGDQAAALLGSTERFALSQDQPHTLRARVGYRLSPSAWLSFDATYNSGLPVELEGDDELDDLVGQFGRAVVDRVDLEAGRVRPALSLDASAGVVLLKRGQRTLRLQADVRNLADRLNVINFAGLFSGTAIAPPRSVSLGLRAGW